MQTTHQSASTCLKIVLLAILTLNISGCKRQAPIYDPPAVTYPNLLIDDPKTEKSIPALGNNEPRPKLTLLDMESAIIEGCAKRGWVPVKVKTGEINATLNLREHNAVVNIAYTAQRFSVKYVTSNNLNYGRDEKGIEQIHPNYNSWVKNLKNDITLTIVQVSRNKATNLK